MPKINETKNTDRGFPEISMIEKTERQKNTPTYNLSGNMVKDGMNKPSRTPDRRKAAGIILFLFEDRKIAKL